MEEKYSDWQAEIEACNELGRQLVGEIDSEEQMNMIRAEIARAASERNPAYQALLLTPPFFGGGVL
jgi:hypothetical protein